LSDRTNFVYDIIKDEHTARQNGYNDLLDNFQRGINISEDLSFLFNIRNELQKFPIPKELKDLIQKISYQPNVEQKSTRTGIKNVEDLYQNLLDYLTTVNPDRQFGKVLSLFGTFTIHTDVIKKIDDLHTNSFEFERNPNRR
jgi:hypothetical protein